MPLQALPLQALPPQALSDRLTCARTDTTEVVSLVVLSPIWRALTTHVAYWEGTRASVSYTELYGRCTEGRPFGTWSHERA